MSELTKEQKETLSMDYESGMKSLIDQYKNRKNKPVFKILGSEESAVEHGQAQCSDASWCCEFRRNECNGEACPGYTPVG